MSRFRFIDTHCHIHFAAYREDMDAVIERSLEGGVGMITVGTQIDTSLAAIDVAQRYEGIWATIGLHPLHLHKQTFHDAQELENPTVTTRSEQLDMDAFFHMAKHPKVVAIGEFGLDFYHKPEDIDEQTMRNDQITNALTQIDLATKLHKPIVVHCRDAHEEQLSLLKEAVEQGKLNKRGVVHCFTGTLEQACAYIDLGFYISFTGILTFSKELAHIAGELPLERLMVETDAPYLSPAPHRGRKNEPLFVKHIAQALAHAHDRDYEEIAQITTQNAKHCFDINV